MDKVKFSPEIYRYIFSKTMPQHLKDFWDEREIISALLKGHPIEHMSSVPSKVYHLVKKMTGGSMVALWAVFIFMIASVIFWFVLLGQLISRWSFLPQWCKWTALVLLVLGTIIPGLPIAGVIMVSVVLERIKKERDEVLEKAQSSAAPQQVIMAPAQDAVPAAASPRKKISKSRSKKSRSKKITRVISKIVK